MHLPPRVLPLIRQGYGLYAKLRWTIPPRNIFVVKKDYNNHVREATKSFIGHIIEKYKVNVLVEDRSYEELAQPGVISIDQSDLKRYVDLVVTLGGDGTILHATSLFNRRAEELPPVLSFSMGTLGFLLPFDFSEAQQAFHDVYTSNVCVMQRQRLDVSVETVSTLASQTPDSEATTHSTLLPDPWLDYPTTPSNSVRPSGLTCALNDLTIHRGASPHLAHLDISVNDEHITTAIADGLTISTPTGSTAYSLSAGGSIVHPGVPCVMLTPICPRSLSFRPLILPQTSKISVSISPNSRGVCDLSIDGYADGQLATGDVVHVCASATPVWCVSKATDDWVHHLNGLLGFNSKFGKK